MYLVEWFDGFEYNSKEFETEKEAKEFAKDIYCDPFVSNLQWHEHVRV